MSENNQVNTPGTITAEQAKKNIQAKNGKTGAKPTSKGKVPPLALIIAGGILIICLGLYVWSSMNKEPEQTAVAPEEAPVSVDSVANGINNTQATYNPGQKPLQDNSIADDTAFIVDESIVFKDPTTGQYMINYKNMSYPIDSDLGKEAVLFYQQKGTNPLVLLQRLQEKEANQLSRTNAGGPTNGVETSAEVQNIKAERDDLKSLVEIQDRTIKELKTSLITIAKTQKQERSQLSTESDVKTKAIKGAKSLPAFAVVGDRAWLENTGNQPISVTVGDMLPNGGKVVAVDGSGQKIWYK
ncbi:TPA: hypothetical protein MW242_003081 [Acinetobacter baumannii]|nr:hypothetical protein [Acinetobacter baumannii]